MGLMKMGNGDTGGADDDLTEGFVGEGLHLVAWRVVACC